jgi:cell division protein FtsQ
MDTKKAIRKILFIALWLAIGGGMITLLAAAMGKKNKELCSDYTISIKAKRQMLFVDENDVLQLLTQAVNGPVKGRPVAAFNLRRMEELLKDNVWVKDAQLYFDNKDVLHVIVTEREPIARIFTTSGNSFYLDNEAKRLPVSDKLVIKVPLFNHFPEEEFVSEKQKALLNDICTAAEYILNNPFWMSQVAHIDITNELNFEMVPTVGNHIVKLGSGEDIAKKFHRLYVFYNDILSKTGFDYYKNIDVQYAGQVVADKGKTLTKVDVVQLKKNVDKLLQEAQKMENDTTLATNAVIGKDNK